MAAKTNNFSNAFLELIFNGTSITNLAQNIVSGAATTLYVSLHNSALSATSTQSSNETSYGSYARVGISRSSGGWTVTSNSVSPVASITFSECTGGTDTLVAFGVGLSASGAGTLLWFGTLSPNLSISTGVQPILTTSSFVEEQ